MNDFFDKIIHLNWHLAVVMGGILVVGGMLGYTLGFADGGYEQAVVEPQIRQNPQAVLGAKAKHSYVNPLDLADIREVRFPVSQLKGCRNYLECQSFCRAADNFATCAAWARSQGLIE